MPSIQQNCILVCPPPLALYNNRAVLITLRLLHYVFQNIAPCACMQLTVHGASHEIASRILRKGNRVFPNPRIRFFFEKKRGPDCVPDPFSGMLLVDFLNWPRKKVQIGELPAKIGKIVDIWSTLLPIP